MMEAIRSYLTAVVAVSMIAVLASALSHGSRMERVVRFAAVKPQMIPCAIFPGSALKKLMKSKDEKYETISINDSPYVLFFII